MVRLLLLAAMAVLGGCGHRTVSVAPAGPIVDQQGESSFSVTFDAQQMYRVANNAYTCGLLDGAEKAAASMGKPSFKAMFTAEDLELCEAVKAILGIAGVTLPK